MAAERGAPRWHLTLLNKPKVCAERLVGGVSAREGEEEGGEAALGGGGANGHKSWVLMREERWCWC